MKTSIIVLDLTQTLKEIESICKEYGIDFEIIKYNKVNGVHLLWIDISVKQIINYKLNGLDEVKALPDQLLKMEPVKAKVLPIVLETDAILDKIGQYGINSLDEEELEFLRKS